MTRTAAGNPSSAEPMRGLSSRAQKLLAPKPYGQNPQIEPKGEALRRYAKTKTRI